MARDASAVVVAGNGDVYIAPEGTPLPVDLAALASPWDPVGWIGEDGVTHTLSRDTEDILPWQDVNPLRTLITSEPITIAFELLQFDPTGIELALRGGTITSSGVAPDEIATYEPPDPGSQNVLAMVIAANDGDADFMFCYPRVQLSGDVEFALVRSDATRLPLEFSVLAADEKWHIISDHPAWVAGASVLTGGSPSASRASGSTATTAVPA